MRRGMGLGRGTDIDGRDGGAIGGVDFRYE